MTQPITSYFPPEDVPDTGDQTALYRFFGAKGELLYVGITRHPRDRWRQHAKAYADSWWPLVRSQSVDWFPNREDAESAERQAIVDEAPLYNIVHSTPSRSLRWRVARQSSDLLELVRRQIPGRPFTTVDVVAASGLTTSEVGQGLGALVARAELVVVGVRHVVTAGEIREDQALYSLPLHEWVDGATNLPLAEAPAENPQVRPSMVRHSPEEPPRPAGVALETLPAVVTFTKGAALLVRRGLARSMTSQGLQHIAKTRSDWPFGDGEGKEPYGLAGKARLMNTETFLRYFEEVYTPTGRGPAQKSGQGAGGVS